MTKDKREFRKRITAFFSVFLCLLLVGCQTSVVGQKEQITAVTGEEKEEQPEETTKTQTKSLVLGIDRPTVSSNIAIDLQGYAPEDIKYARFTGADLQDTFYVYRQKDKQAVYQGSIQKTGEEGAWGDFSEVTEPGSYYIQTAVIGRSYTFQIYEDRYQTQFETDRESWRKTAPEDFYTAGEETDYQALLILAMLQEFYAEPEEEDSSKLQEAADYLIQYHTEQAKSSVSGSDVDMADVRAGYSYAAAMAQCYHVLKNEAGAAAYLKQAQTAYQTAARSRSRTDTAVSPEQYMAAAALFKATGSYSYHQVIKQYEAAEDITEDTTAGFWGDLFYLTSLQRVDTKLCEQQMNRLLKECGELSDSVLSQHAMENRADSLTAMLKLAVADDTLVSLEYRNACKTLLHAFCSDMEDIDCGQRSALLFIEGELAESEVKK